MRQRPTEHITDLKMSNVPQDFKIIAKRDPENAFYVFFVGIKCYCCSFYPPEKTREAELTRKSGLGGGGNVPVKSKLQHPSPPEAEKLFKGPIIGPFQVIKCPHPRETFR